MRRVSDEIRKTDYEPAATCFIVVDIPFPSSDTWSVSRKQESELLQKAGNIKNVALFVARRR